MTLNGGTVALLCRAGAVLNSRNNREETPLLLAAGVNSTPVMQALLQQGADVTLADEVRLAVPSHPQVEALLSSCFKLFLIASPT
jgi:ankyrin repeat protein